MVWLTPAEVERFSHLTTEALSLVLKDIAGHPVGGRNNEDQAFFAAGTALAGIPAALLVVRQPCHGELELLSLAVAKQFRRLGLATSLLAWLYEEALQQGWQSLTLRYPLDHAYSAAMARLTNPELGWQHYPGLRLVTLDRSGGLKLLKRLTPLSARWRASNRFQLINWGALSTEQHAELESAQLRVPQWARPTANRYSETLEQRDDHASQVLLDQGLPAGWITVHRVGTSLFRVSQWWVMPHLQQRGIALILLHRALKHALAAYPQYSRGSFGIGLNNSAMARLSQKYIEPLASKICLTEEATRIMTT